MQSREAPKNAVSWLADARRPSLSLSAGSEVRRPPRCAVSCFPACLFLRLLPAEIGWHARAARWIDMNRAPSIRAIIRFLALLRSPYLDADAFEISALPLLGESPPPSAVDREGLLDGAGGSPVIPHVLCRALRTLCEGTFLSRPAAMDSAVERATDERQDASRG